MTIQRGLLLYQQSRYELAETELRQALGADPGDAYAHALLALCLIERKQLDDATEVAGQAVHLAPDHPFSHYALAKAWYERNHLDRARAAIEEAIRLHPGNAEYRFLLSAIHFDERRWKESLEVAEQGLEIDPEHSGCTNLRAMALVKLGRRGDAGATIEAALARDPENAATHANQGWTLLEHRKIDRSLEHFREALRLDPENEWARAGIVEALKARNPIYAVMLRYFLWMSRLSSQAQWGVIIGGVVANRMLTTAAQTNPDLAPWLLPFRILYVTFVLLTWTADPLFNLLLRLDPFGRLALSREQVLESNWVGAAVLLGLISLGAGFVWGFDGPFLRSAMVFGFLLIPLSATFKMHEGWPRTMMSRYTLVLAVVGFISVVRSVRSDEAGWEFFLVFLLGAVASGWVANFLMGRRPKR